MRGGREIYEISLYLPLNFVVNLHIISLSYVVDSNGNIIKRSKGHNPLIQVKGTHFCTDREALNTIYSDLLTLEESVPQTSYPGKVDRHCSHCKASVATVFLPGSFKSRR